MFWRAVALLGLLWTTGSVVAQSVFVEKDTLLNGAAAVGQSGPSVSTLEDLSYYGFAIIEAPISHSGVLDTVSITLLIPSNFSWPGLTYEFLLGRSATQFFSDPLVYEAHWSDLIPSNSGYQTPYDTFGATTRHLLTFNVRPKGFQVASGETLSIAISLRHATDNRIRRLSFANPSMISASLVDDAYARRDASTWYANYNPALNFASRCYAAKVTVVTAGSNSLNGVLQFEDWGGIPIGEATLEFLDSNFVVRETRVASLDTNGAFSVVPPSAGSYWVSVKQSHWLRKIVGPTTFPGTNNLGTLSLTNGDIDEDNEVAIGDYSILSQYYGTFGTEADLDGDEEVSISDFAILSANFGEFGD